MIQQEQTISPLLIQEKTNQILDTLKSLAESKPRGLASHTGFQEKTVSRAVERSLSIKGELREGLKRLYGEELSSLSIPETNNEKGQTNIFESLFKDVFDQGTSKKRKCDIPDVIEPFEEEPAPILTRSTFITRVLQEHRRQNEEKDKHDVSIGLIDLHNLRGADFDVDGQQDKPADVLINKTARAIRNTFKELGYSTKDMQETQGKSWEVGRYGGDEFVIGLFGKFTSEEKNNIYKRIQENLRSEKYESYYQYEDPQGGKHILKEPIQLKEVRKGEFVETVEFPHENDPESQFDLESLPHRRIMFKEYLERGLLLTQDEFSRVVKKYSVDNKLNIDLYRRDYPETASNYPEGVSSMAQRIAHIQIQHPELAFYFDLARIFDLTESGNGSSTKRSSILLEVVENSLFDRLIGEAIYSRDQFQQYLRENEFDSVTTLDLKFVKELNEKTTYADADKAIKTLWLNIKDTLDKGEREKIIAGRFGGTFVLGVRKGMKLSEETTHKLKGLNEMELTFGDSTFVVPIGNSTKENLSQNEDDKSNSLFKSIMYETEKDFYDKIVVDIIAEDYREKGGFIKSIIENDISSLSIDGEGIKKVDLYALFLRGKRKIERVGKLLSTFKTVSTEKNVPIGLAINELSLAVRDHIRKLAIPVSIESSSYEDMLEIYKKWHALILLKET